MSCCPIGLNSKPRACGLRLLKAFLKRNETPIEQDLFGSSLTSLRQFFGYAPRFLRDLFETCSTGLRLLFGYSSTRSRRTVEAHPKDSRSCPEAVSNLSRSGVEDHSKKTKRKVEEMDCAMCEFVRYEKASNPITTQAQPKDDPRTAQETPNNHPITRLEIPKDGLSQTLSKTFLRNVYARGPHNKKLSNIQPTDKKNAVLKQGRGTAVPLLSYCSPTKVVLQSYYGSTKELLNTYVLVTLQYNSSRSVVVPKTKGNVSIAKYVKLIASKCLRPIAYGLMLILVSMFSLSDAWAQSAETQAAEGQTDIKPLQVGDTIPEELWNLPLQVINHPGGKDTITLNDYRDKKLIILDFWSTWCVPCIRSLQVLEETLPLYSDSVAMVATSYESKEKVASFVKEREFRQHYVFEDTLSRKYFPHKYVPHQIWIVNGQIRSITGSMENPGKVIQDILKDKPINVKQKDDLFLDFSIPFENYANERNAPVLMKSIFTGYVDGTGGYGNRNVGNARLYYYLNRAILSLYKDVANIPLNKIMLEVDDEHIVYQKERGFENAYCYLFYAPMNVSEDEVRFKMLADLNFYLGYNARFQKRYTPCKVLRSIRTNYTQRDMPVRKGGKYITIKKFIDLLNYNEEWSSNLVRYINSTDDTAQIWIENNREVQTLKAEPEELKSRLAEFGIGISVENKELDYFVISNSQ